MEKGFGQLAVDFAGRFRDPDKPQEWHEFQESQQLARCIDLLLLPLRLIRAWRISLAGYTSQPRSLTTLARALTRRVAL